MGLDESEKPVKKYCPPMSKLSAEAILETLDNTLASLSERVAEFAGAVEDMDKNTPCFGAWQRFERSAGRLILARELDRETLAEVSVLLAEKDMIEKAVALLDCISRLHSKEKLTEK